MFWFWLHIVQCFISNITHCTVFFWSSQWCFIFKHCTVFFSLHSDFYFFWHCTVFCCGLRLSQCFFSTFWEKLTRVKKKNLGIYMNEMLKSSCGLYKTSNGGVTRLVISRSRVRSLVMTKTKISCKFFWNMIFWWSSDTHASVLKHGEDSGDVM